jgi:hypothetical protein
MQIVCKFFVKFRPHTDRETLPTEVSIEKFGVKDFKLRKPRFEEGQINPLIIANIR